MSSLAILGYGEIRVTDDSRYSVFDTIEVIGGRVNPRDAWKNLCTQYSEVVGKIDNFQFAGRGQRLTPVANKLNILYIIGLLPGVVGRSYREDAAKAMYDKLEGRQEIDAAIAVLQGHVNPKNKKLGELYAAIAVLQESQESTATLERHVNPKKLGELYAQKHHLSEPVSSQKINAALESAGLQHSESSINSKTGKTRKVWHITDCGQEYVVHQDKSQYSNKTVECVRWLPDVIDLIRI